MNIWDEMGLGGKKAIIVHQDDIGMSDAANRAFFHLQNLGFTTGSVMVPGAWAPQVKSGDLGVHLTLTSEWAYPRMRPLTQGESLVDSAGYFWPTVESAWQHIQEADVAAELRAQIEGCFRLGIDVTHLDTHMGTVMRPDIAQVYHDLAVEYRLPCLLIDLRDRPIPEPMRTSLDRLLSSSPLPTFRLVDTYPVPPTERASWYADTLSQLGPGVYHLIHHAAAPTPEGQQIPDWERRVGDFEALQNTDVRRILSEFTLLTYRDVRDAMRKYM